MSEIVLSAAVRQNLLALQDTAALQATTQNRLATGKKVNSALDNPVSFFTASALSARGDQLSTLLDQMRNGINTIQAANNGLTSITSTIQSLEATVTQARQDSSWQNGSFSINSAAIGTASLKTLTFSGGAVSGNQTINLNDTETVTGAGGFASADTLGAGNAGNITIQAADINGGNAVTVALTTADTSITAAAKINAAVGIANFASDNAGQLKLQDAAGNVVTIGGTAATLAGAGVAAGTSTATAGPVQSVDNLVSLINGNASLAGKVKATNNAGQLQITNLSTSALTVAGITGTSVDGSTGTTTIGANTVRANLVTTFNQLRDQLDKTASDSSFNGFNLLNGDQLKLIFNEIATSSLTIQSTAPTGINNTVLGISSATNAQFQDNSQLDSALNALNNALTMVRSQASAFGSNLSIVQNRQTFTTAMINTLQSGSDSLTLADTNLEGANMLALQTRQQLSTTALALANQANQAVLRLFG